MQILDVFPQTTSGLRAKAMKALSTIVAADPHVLAMVMTVTTSSNIAVDVGYRILDAHPFHS